MHGVGCWRDEWVGGWVGGRSGRTCIRRDPKSADRWVERVDLFFSFHGYTISVSLLVLTLVFHVCFIFRSVGLFVFWGLVFMFVFMVVTFWVSSPFLFCFIFVALFLFRFHFPVAVNSFVACGVFFFFTTYCGHIFQPSESSRATDFNDNFFNHAVASVSASGQQLAKTFYCSSL